MVTWTPRYIVNYHGGLKCGLELKELMIAPALHNNLIGIVGTTEVAPTLDMLSTVVVSSLP